MLEIEIPTGLFNFKLDAPLDGVTYRFKFAWNIRLEIWTFSLFESDDTPIIQGQKLVTAANLLDRFQFENAPTQGLYLFDTSGLDEPVTLLGLGDRWRLLYGTPVQ